MSLAVPVGEDGGPVGAVERFGGVAEAVLAHPEVERWVWQSTATSYPRVLAAGARVRVPRCWER